MSFKQQWSKTVGQSNRKGIRYIAPKSLAAHTIIRLTDEYNNVTMLGGASHIYRYNVEIKAMLAKILDVQNIALSLFNNEIQPVFEAVLLLYGVKGNMSAMGATAKQFIHAHTYHALSSWDDLIALYVSFVNKICTEYAVTCFPNLDSTWRLINRDKTVSNLVGSIACLLNVDLFDLQNEYVFIKPYCLESIHDVSVRNGNWTVAVKTITPAKQDSSQTLEETERNNFKTKYEHAEITELFNSIEMDEIIDTLANLGDQ